jgi:hypothetical protein
MTNTQQLRWWGILAVIVLAAAGLLALDLATHGLVWRTFWSLTGEEQPLAQIRGMVEWLGNFTRLQPRTDPLTPIDHAWENPYGINTFLQQEVEVPKIERELQMIHEAGFYWLRQEFPWADIEVDGRGKFSDSRNDLNGDGKPDTVDAWAKYDRIVGLVEKYGLHLQVRLSSPPKWAQTAPGAFAPPGDVQDYVNYAVAVAQRYKGRILYYQVWNEPNIYPEWGEQAVNPEAYTDLLCRTYRALKAVDPNIVVISGALAPTVSLTGRDLSDFIFLQRMYDAGAGACFDILSQQGYGLNSGPTDHRMRPTTINYGRNQYIRDLMIANGDARKAMWISEAAWNAIPDDPGITGYGQYGIVTQEQAARYMPIAYQRAQQEWPWVGVINYWFFTRPSNAEQKQASYYFRMVEPDYSADKPDFTPLPVYNAVKDYIHSQTPTLYTGVHQAEDWRITLPSDAIVYKNAPEADFGRYVHTREVSFIAYGTDIIVRWEGETPPEVEVDNEKSSYWISHSMYEGSSSRFQSTLVHSFLTQNYQVHISGFGESSIAIYAITILDRSFENIFPLAAVGVALAVFALWVIVRAWQERRR